MTLSLRCHRSALTYVFVNYGIYPFFIFLKKVIYLAMPVHSSLGPIGYPKGEAMRNQG